MKAIINGIMGQKIKMSRIYTEDKKWIPVTILWVPKGKIVEKYNNTISVAYYQCKSKVVNKPQKVIFNKFGDECYKHRKNFTLINEYNINIGDYISGDHFFQEEERIFVTGKTNGKGFCGAMKAHGFAGLCQSHGVSLKHRSPGSTGCRTSPGKVFKGTKMAKNMGNTNTCKMSTVIKWHPEEEIVILYGSIPGKKNWVKLWRRV